MEGAGEVERVEVERKGAGGLERLWVERKGARGVEWKGAKEMRRPDISTLTCFSMHFAYDTYRASLSRGIEKPQATKPKKETRQSSTEDSEIKCSYELEGPTHFV